MDIQCMIIMSWQEDTSSPTSICSREKPFGNEVYPLACTHYTSFSFTMSKRTLTVLNERHWISGECSQQRRNAQNACESKAPGGSSEGHLLTLKNQLFPWPQIESPVRCVCVCVLNVHICSYALGPLTVTV